MLDAAIVQNQAQANAMWKLRETVSEAQKPEGACDVDVIGKRRITAQFLGARNVPFLIRDDGLTREGKPTEGLRAWIENNRI